MKNVISKSRNSCDKITYMVRESASLLVRNFFCFPIWAECSFGLLILLNIGIINSRLSLWDIKYVVYALVLAYEENYDQIVPLLVVLGTKCITSSTWCPDLISCSLLIELRVIIFIWIRFICSTWHAILWIIYFYLEKKEKREI